MTFSILPATAPWHSQRFRCTSHVSESFPWPGLWASLSALTFVCVRCRVLRTEALPSGFGRGYCWPCPPEPAAPVLLVILHVLLRPQKRPTKSNTPCGPQFPTLSGGARLDLQNARGKTALELSELMSVLCLPWV